MNYFELLDLVPSYYIDPQLLKKNYYSISRKTHPDNFATSEPDTLAAAEKEYSEINQAYETLSDDPKRLEYILEWQEVIVPGENYQLPPDFLMEMLELNELKLSDEAEAQTQIQYWKTSLDEALEQELKGTDIQNLTKEQKAVLKDTYYKQKYVQRLQ